MVKQLIVGNEYNFIDVLSELTTLGTTQWLDVFVLFAAISHKIEYPTKLVAKFKIGITRHIRGV